MVKNIRISNDQFLYSPKISLGVNSFKTKFYKILYLPCDSMHDHLCLLEGNIVVNVLHYIGCSLVYVL